MKPELKTPCPCCGGPMAWCAEVASDDEPDGHPCDQITCTACHFNVDFHGSDVNAANTLEEAYALVAARWNGPTPPPECKTEAEKNAFAFGWFKALEAQRAGGVPLALEALDSLVTGGLALDVPGSDDPERNRFLSWCRSKGLVGRYNLWQAWQAALTHGVAPSDNQAI